MTTEIIDASPTKEFFINMLTRDIPLDRAILDLIDNSIDAYHANSPENPTIEISLDGECFSIKDNCGGIDKATAKNYAFRFGRTKDSPETPGSVGQFGVGMKRTLFKIGKAFKVISKRNNEAFEVTVNIDDWLKTDKWEFNFSVHNDTQINDGETLIIVDTLNEEISEKFQNQNFENSLRREISQAHFKAINNGVKVLLNSKDIAKYELKVLHSDVLKPYCQTVEKNGVIIKIIAGIYDRKLDEGGWYIVCNGRLVEEAEQSKLTGWGDSLPKYHADFAYFRGIVDFTSDDSSKLPWTTTKTGVDEDNSIYRTALHYMNKSAKQVIAFLRERATEDNNFLNDVINDKPQNSAIDNANRINIYDVNESESFTYPSKANKIRSSTLSTISYKVDKEELDAVKESLGVSTNKDVGEETFKYYYKYECK